MESGGSRPKNALISRLFLLSAESDGITGKFISRPGDPWDRGISNALRSDKDLCTIREDRQQAFCRKPRSG